MHAPPFIPIYKHSPNPELGVGKAYAADGNSTSLRFLLLQRVVCALHERQSVNTQLGASRLIAEANKQLTRTCVVVTVFFLCTLGIITLTSLVWQQIVIHFTTIMIGLQIVEQNAILASSGTCETFRAGLLFLLTFWFVWLSGFELNYYFLGRWGFVPYLKNNFVQKLCTCCIAWRIHDFGHEGEFGRGPWGWEKTRIFRVSAWALLKNLNSSVLSDPKVLSWSRQSDVVWILISQIFFPHIMQWTFSHKTVSSSRSVFLDSEQHGKPSHLHCAFAQLPSGHACDCLPVPKPRLCGVVFHVQRICSPCGIAKKILWVVYTCFMPAKNIRFTLFHVESNENGWLFTSGGQSGGVSWREWNGFVSKKPQKGNQRKRPNSKSCAFSGNALLKCVLFCSRAKILIFKHLQTLYKNKKPKLLVLKCILKTNLLTFQENISWHWKNTSLFTSELCPHLFSKFYMAEITEKKSKCVLMFIRYVELFFCSAAKE